MIQPNDDDINKACDDLFAYLDEQPGKRMNAVNLSDFYKRFPQHEQTVKTYKHVDQKRGIRSVCGANPDRLGFMKDRSGPGKDILYIYQTNALTTPLESIQNRLSVTRGGYRRRGDDALSEVEDMLQAMKLDGTSVKKLKAEIRAKGICLKDGSECGSKLVKVLRNNPALCVNVEKVKKFPLARMCLVVT